MVKDKYLDEKLAKASRVYLEEQIEKEKNKVVWKGEVYRMRRFIWPLQQFRMDMPELFVEFPCKTKVSGMPAPFAVLLSENRDISCTLYFVRKPKAYEPVAAHKMFDILYPDHEMSDLEILQNRTLEVYRFHYISKERTGRFFHTIFGFATAAGQVTGHYGGELSELQKLKQIEQKFLLTIQKEELRHERTVYKN